MLRIDQELQGTEFYRFPKLYLTLRNTNAAQVTITQFDVHIEHAEVVETPVLNFKMHATRDWELHVQVKHTGWGTLQEVEVELDEPVLNQLLDISTRRFSGTLSPGITQELFSLPKELVPLERVEALGVAVSEINYFESSTMHTTTGVALGPLRLVWRCKDEHGHSYEGIEEFQPDTVHLRGFELTKLGFLSAGAMSWFHYAPLDVGTDARMKPHILMLDPLTSIQTYVFKLARSIPSGEVVHFTLPLGAKISCRLRLRLAFHTASVQIVASEPLHLDIWNQQDSKWEEDYKDGAEFANAIEELQQYTEANPEAKHVEYYLLKYLRRRTAIYPFINPQDSPLCGLWGPEPDPGESVWGEE